MSATSPTARPSTQRRVAWIIAGLCALGVAGIVAWPLLWPGDARYLATLVTQEGETRTVTLPDGATLRLHANTRLEIRYEDTKRQIDLDAGQAVFSVPADPAKPFIVRAGGLTATTPQAHFDVWHDEKGTRVAVESGAVHVVTSSWRHGIEVDVNAEEAVEIEDDGRATPVLPMIVTPRPDGSLDVRPR